MTVAELIEYLKTLPQNFPVIYRYHSDYAVLRAEEITIQQDTDKLQYYSVVPHHNMPGEFRSFNGPHEYKNLPLPAPANVVVFPGN